MENNCMISTSDYKIVSLKQMWKKQTMFEKKQKITNRKVNNKFFFFFDVDMCI